MSNVRPHMTHWPSLKSVLLVWGAISAVSYVAYVLFLHGSPPDELSMGSTLSLQATIGVIVVGVPAVVLLFLALLIGAIAKRWLVESKSRGGAQKRVV